MTEKIIEIKNLTYHYQGRNQASLKNVDLTINQEDWVSLIGSNGSGKSTLAKLIVGLLEDESNSIKVFGQIMNEANGNQLRDQIGMVFQNPENQFVSATVLDDVAFALENQGMARAEMQKRVEEALAAVEMTGFANQTPSQLSGGQMQRVALAGVIAQRPQLVILDEATSMLDPMTRAQVLKVVQKLHDQGTTVLAITHDINETLWSDQIVLLDQGEVKAQAKPSDMYVQSELLKTCGLTTPLTYQIQEALGIDDGYLNEEELIKRLWKLN
ncbi:energy-coupling factor transporter ATPase [Fructilactobacillus sp. Tb1]|uniref:energy-coupling factor transporter ATPase n=1 Tax=Fructilactobacillus sp. Tb1 TaxID=3422304 RepID=UPI003D2A2ACF